MTYGNSRDPHPSTFQPWSPSMDESILRRNGLRRKALPAHGRDGRGTLDPYTNRQSLAQYQISSIWQWRLPPQDQDN
jgi:hypothetical protein